MLTGDYTERPRRGEDSRSSKRSRKSQENPACQSEARLDEDKLVRKLGNVEVLSYVSTGRSWYNSPTPIISAFCPLLTVRLEKWFP
jgi:hypothetical protein